MKFGLTLTAVVATLVILWYALGGRSWLKSKLWAQSFFVAIEPVEIFLYKKSETILIARFKIFVGLLLSALTSLGALDLTPIMPFVPEKYAFLAHAAINLLPLAISIVGLIDEKLRNTTTKPVELVALPDKAVENNPRIAEAVAMAEVTKVEAVAVVTEEKAA